jgi:hypothetical protein
MADKNKVLVNVWIVSGKNDDQPSDNDQLFFW